MERRPTHLTALPDLPSAIAAPDLVAEDIAEAVADLDDGRYTRARRRLASIWAHLPHNEAVHRSAVAHWIAATTSEPGLKRTWDERALSAAEAADDWSVPFAGTALTLGDVHPELHLALAEDHCVAGSACGALEHLALARNAVEMAPPGQRKQLRRRVRDVDRLSRDVRGAAPSQEWARDQRADRDQHSDRDQRWGRDRDWGRCREADTDLADFWGGEHRDDPWDEGGAG